MPLLRHPDARLYTPCPPVTPDEFGPDLTAHLDAMVEVMLTPRANGRPQGVGLAAPQVGFMRRAIVVKAGSDATLYRMVNPVVTRHPQSRDESAPESCLSMPDLSVSVPRATKIGVTWQSETGEMRAGLFVGFEARVIQHEVDHLDGRTLLHHARPAARREYERRFGSTPTND